MPQPSTPCTSKDTVTMIEVQSPTYPASSRVESCGCAELHGSSPSTSMSMNSKMTLVEYRLIPGGWAFRDVPAISRVLKSVTESLQTSRDPAARRLAEYTAEVPMSLPQRKSVNEVLSEYTEALSTKKNAVLALASAQVSCEESEAVLLEACGEAYLKRICNVHYVTDDPKSATGRYFDVVSAIRFDPLEL
ncbi:hypothetical protein JVT61DRAFT_12611 [Boletus reticuloceps]|uniref:Uncharacterized protein n=1 Tax=Boletus reticuloceps TaxID=495285 RepID=A0A8I3A398_9AGAM|nr:hypothetical protein JVT61DRAFT_12611 [Boletus reticuloceps]